MEPLRDLHQLANDVVKNFEQNFNAGDCKIPEEFKTKVKFLNSFSVVYNDYSVVIKGDGTRSFDSYVPNQCFYMASFFIEYSNELSNYKQKIISLISKAGIPTSQFTAFFTEERDNGKRNIDQGNDKFIKILDSRGYNDSDRDYLIKFVTDYDWWHGSKTIERSDFYNSPVLTIMGLTASSNAAMALIVNFLTQNPELNSLLKLKTGNIMTGPLQQIFYGAPGTGKSRKIKDDKGVKEADEKDLVFRTTFHPDSDYSTFVGAYKPTMRPVADKYKAVAGKDEEITYSFVPQAFLQAYVAAWNNPDENVYLIIEEINRGNCAQIFGDLFQLLDRDEDGFSDYPIKADKDLANYLNGKDENGQDILTDKNGIKNGKLKLPRNLYIWATMNTSDQSLFPIDSAFKRRWDWQYMPISDGRKGWKIEAAGNRYNWWQFLEKINNVIGATTHSEDKQLGYYFCRTKGGIINADTFVGKVIFYLWNDVFKDFADEAGSLFVDDDGNTLTFSKFYSTASGSTAVIEDKVALFLKNLGVDILPIVEGDEPDNGDDKDYEQFSVSYNGKVFNGKPSDVFISTLEEIGLEKLVDRSIGGNALVTREKPNGRSRKVGDYYIYTGWWPTYKKRWLEKVANELTIDLKFE